MISTQEKVVDKFGNKQVKLISVARSDLFIKLKIHCLGICADKVSSFFILNLSIKIYLYCESGPK